MHRKINIWWVTCSSKSLHLYHRPMQAIVPLYKDHLKLIGQTASIAEHFSTGSFNSAGCVPTISSDGHGTI